MKKILKCRICNSQDSSKVLSLKKTPLEDNFLNQKNKNTKQLSFPLQLNLCNNCGYVYLPQVLSPKKSYSYYLYNSEVTLGLKKHYKNYAKEVNNLTIKKNKKFCVDIGSNDGTLLSGFKSLKYNVVGVEPAKLIAKKANKRGIKTLNSFFNKSVTKKILKLFSKPDVICANYVFANIDNIRESTKIIKSFLSDEGLLVIETGYHPEQFKKNMFDYIYHEHFSYFSLGVLKKFFKQFKFKIIKAKITKQKGGSIRLIITHDENNKKIDNSVERIVKNEKKLMISKKNYFKKFENRILRQKKNLLKYLNNFKDNVIGFGASHSTTVLLHHFEIGKKIDYLIDDNRIKHNLYSPGFKLKVKPVINIKGKIIILLAWQHQKKILERHKNLIKQNKIIIPLPKFKIR